MVAQEEQAMALGEKRSSLAMSAIDPLDTNMSFKTMKEPTPVRNLLNAKSVTNDSLVTTT
jgi:hypothetical protein